MLIIRNEQKEQLSQVTKDVFEDRMVVHIYRHFPDTYKPPDEENCRELIRYGITQAGSHGFVAEREVCKFIDLMVCFGSDFDTDEELTWADEVLSDTSWINARAKMDGLFKAGIDFLKKQS